MATSGSYNWILTRDNIIYAALENVGAYAFGQVPMAEYVSSASRTLNIMQQAWQNRGLFLWAQADDVQVLTAATASYTLDSDIVAIEQVMFREDEQDTLLSPYTREEYKALADKAVAGSPTHYYYDYRLAAPVLYLWPVYAYTTSVKTGTDAAAWLCNNNHTSAAASKPVTGASYADYWETTSETPSVWVTATAYYSGIVKFTKIRRLQDFDAAADNPDAPVRAYQALISGLTFRIAPKFGIRSGTEYDRMKLQAEQDFAEMMGGNTESADLRISVRL